MSGDETSVNMSLDTVLNEALGSSGARSGQDAIVMVLHSCLLAEGFVCVAVGDENFGEDTNKELPPLSTPSSPAPPPHWNDSQDVYALQYMHERTRQLCLVKIIPFGGQLLVNALAANRADEVHSVTLDTSRFIKTGCGDFTSQDSFTNLLQLASTLNKELVTRLAQSSSTPSGGSSTSRPRDREERRNRDPRPLPGDDDPLRVGPPRHPRMPFRDPDPLAMPGPFGLGEGDRQPFGAGGGGMIFDPLRGGRGIPGPGPMGPFPPSHPSGARFDPVYPFGPRPMPGRGPRGGRGGGGGGGYDPDPDHLPPPGYDDMFS